MRVVLIQNVPGVGKIDDIKEISEGYARNFLFARNLAVPASEKMLAELRIRQDKKTKDNAKELHANQVMAEKIEGREVVLKEKVGAGGSLYAAVGAQKISEALARIGFKINKEQILLKGIKDLGQHQVKVRFPHGLEATITVIISKI